MAEFIGQNQQVHSGSIGGKHFFKSVSIADFQAKFRYLQNADFSVVENALLDAVIEVDYALLSFTSQFDSFADLVAMHGLDEPAIIALYERAVFNFAIAHLLSVEITTNDTKGASDRADNLAERIDMHNASARHAISMLSIDNNMKIEVV